MWSSDMAVAQQVPMPSPVARLAKSSAIWLRGSNPVRGAAMRLMDHSRFAGLELEVHSYDELQIIPFWRYDLVLLEQTRGQDTGTMTAAIKRVRQLSQAPLVVLARRVTPELTMAGLHAGADSVSLLQSSDRVLLAHWGAMLRRWKPLS